jgi:guanylate kinase
LSKILGNLPQGLLFVVSAPAGTGKTTLVEKLTREFSSVVRNVSCTTRAPRPGEKEGKDYFFFDKKTFESKIQKGEFLEHAKVFGEYYGTSDGFIKKMQAAGKHVVLIIDTQGALTLQKHFKRKNGPIFIFISPPSFAELKERLNKRQTENRQSMKERLAWAKHELEMVPHYDYHIVNDDLATAYAVLKSIFIAEEHKVRRNT